METRICILLVVLGLLIAWTFEAKAQEARLNEDGSATITLTKEQVAQCLSEGGCSVITLTYEQILLQEGIERGKKMCGKEI